MNIINIGIIGVGDSCIDIHLPALSKISNAKVVSIFDIDQKKINFYKNKIKVKDFYTSEKLFFSNHDIDAVVITSPNYLHFKHIMMALKNGKHVLCEKPFVLKKNEIIKIKNLALKKNLICTCFLMQRYREPSLLLKKKRQQNFFGEIYHSDINIIMRRSSTINKNIFVNKKFAGSGIIYDVGTHFIDLSCYLMGYPNPKFIYAIGNNELSKLYKKDNSLNKNYNINDFVSGLVKFDNGCTLNFQLSYISNNKKDVKKITFYSKKSVIEWPSLKFNLLVNNKSHTSKISNNEKTKASILQIKDFLKAINGKKNNIASFDEIFKLTNIIESLNKSELKK